MKIFFCLALVFACEVCAAKEYPMAGGFQTRLDAYIASVSKTSVDDSYQNLSTMAECYSAIKVSEVLLKNQKGIGFRKNITDAKEFQVSLYSSMSFPAMRVWGREKYVDELQALLNVSNTIVVERIKDQGLPVDLLTPCTNNVAMINSYIDEINFIYSGNRYRQTFQRF